MLYNDKGDELSKTTSIMLDVFRIVSSLMVFWGHAFSAFAFSPFKDNSVFLHIQSLAVINFFVLSGFFMAYSIDYKFKYSYRNYIIHQGKGVYMTYIPCVFILYICDLIYNAIHNGKGHVISNLDIGTFLSNMFMLQGIVSSPLGSNRPLWTMTYEWWSYVVVALVIVKVKRFIFESTTFLNKLLLSTVMILIVATYLFLLKDGIPLIVDFTLGACIYFLIHELSKRFDVKHFGLYGIIILILMSAIILFAGIEYRNAYVLPIFLAVPLLFLGICILGMSPILHGMQSNKMIRFVGKSTFCLYLVHYPILSYMTNFESKERNNSVLLSLIAFIVVCYLSLIIRRIVDNIFRR